MTPIPVLTLGALLGVLYGMLAVGLILIFRASRVINLAIGAIGVFAATIFQILAAYLRIPFVIAFPLALATGAGAGAVTNMVIVRRFASAPRILVMVLTLGVAVLLTSLLEPLRSLGHALGVRLGFSGIDPASGQPSFLPELRVGPLLVPPRQVLLAILTPLLLTGLVWTLYRTRTGLAVRAVAGNTALVQLIGIRARTITAAVWALAAAAASLAAILGPTVAGDGAGSTISYSLVLRALVAAVLAGMRRLPLAFALGVAIGMAEQVLLWNHAPLWWLDAGILLILLVQATAARDVLGRVREAAESWTLVAADPGWPAAYRRMRVVGVGRVVTGCGLVAAAAVIPTFTSTLTVQTLTQGCGFALACLSVYVLTGLSGQLSLGQFAIAGIAALTSVVTLARTGTLPLALAAGIAAGVAAAAIAAVLAVRRPGTALAALTLTAAGVVPTALLAPAWAFGQGRDPGLPLIGGRPPGTTAVYETCLLTLLAAIWLTTRLRNGRAGRAMLAARDNPELAQAFGVRTAHTRLRAFLLSGVLASLAGILIAHTSITTTPDQYAQDLSVQLVLAVAVGGLTSITGALAGSLWLFTVPQLLPSSGLATSASAVGGLILLLYFPGGIAHALTTGRNHLLTRLTTYRDTRRGPAGGAEPLEPRAGSTAVPRVVRAQPDPETEPLLELQGLEKRFGGLAAVADLSIAAHGGQILALIGPNGAGKTTVFDLISGFEPVTAGTVRYDGRDITRLAPDQRARLGLIRSFQAPTLFPTMTVGEVLAVAAETRQTGRRARDRAITDAVEYYRLAGYREHRTRELSTGTRRIVELAAVHILAPKLLLLDEPSAGIAQRETEALAEVLLRSRADLDLTIIVIEHDLPLAFGIADQVAVMLEGTLLTHGTPEQVRADPAVIDAYLGARHQPASDPNRPEPADTGRRADA